MGSAGLDQRTSAAPILLEREAELARLRALVVAAHASEGAVAVVEGPPGVGKSGLLQAMTAIADEAGCTVLSARGDTLEQGFAFGVARQLFEPWVAALPEVEREALLLGAASLAAPVVDSGRQPGPSHPVGDPFPLLHGLYWLAAGIAERAPLAIVLDDAHAADCLSLRWLHYLCRRLDGVPAVVVLAARSTEPAAPVRTREALEAIKAETGVEVLRPAPLTEFAGATLLGALFGAVPAPELVREAHLATGGNPFLLSELGRSLAADGVTPDGAAAERLREVTPETIARSTLDRLARLPRYARRLARAVAVLGEDAALRHAAALAGLDETQSLSAVDCLVAAGFLAAGPDAAVAQLRLAHPMIRQALYADLPDGRRAGHHKDAARLLAAEPGSVERAAAHLLATPAAADPFVVEVLDAAAAVAMAARAPEIAATFLSRALAEPPADGSRAGVLLALGRAEAQALHPGAVTRLQEAVGAADDPLLRGAALEALGVAHYLRGDTAAAAATAREALAHIPAGRGGDVEAQLLLSCALPGRAVPAQVDEVSALLTRCRTGPEGEATPAELLRVTLAAFDDLLRGERARATQRLRWVEDQPERRRDGTAVLLAGAVGSVQALLGEAREADANLEFALTCARRDGTRQHVVMVLEGRILLGWSRGELARTGADAQTLLELTEEGGAGEWNPLTALARVARAVCLAERGEQLAAADALQLPAGVEQRLPGTWAWVWLPYGRARLAFAGGDWAGAREQALASGERLLAIQAPSPSYLPWRSLAARASAHAGDRDQALALAREELGLARNEDAPRAIGIALTALGVIQGGDDGLRALREAVAALARSPDRLEHARALCELGSMLRRANRRAAARGPLEEAIEHARACGATPIVERAHSELRASGARPRTLAFSGVEALTARERQVAELAAQGWSNPAIAQSLFVTRKTVETHLGSVYRKLDLRSREQLSDALAADSQQHGFV